MQLSKIIAGAAIAVTLAFGTASAAPVTGAVSIDFGTVTDTGAPLAPGSTLFVSGNTFSAPGSGMLLLLAGTTVANFDVTLTAGTPVEFSGSGGSYVGVVSDLAFIFGGLFANVISIDGVFTPNPGFAPFAGLDANSETQVNITFTFIPGDPLGSYSGGGVMSAATPTNPDAVPEPLSLSLFGLGLVGLGMAMRRRPANQIAA